MAGKNEQQRLTGLVHQAAAQVAEQKYDDLIDTFIALGEIIKKYIPNYDLNYGKLKEFDDKADVVRLAIQKILREDNFRRIANINDDETHLSFQGFEAAWEDVHLVKTDAESARSLAVKARLNFSTRHNIKLGMLAFAHLTKLNVENANARKQENIKECNKKAVEALNAYLTTRQKVLNVIANFFTFGAAITFGLTTFAAFLLLPVTWPAVAVFGLASVVGIAGAIVNWNIFKKPVFNFLNDIMGKDKPFEGFTQYINDKGLKAELSPGKKIAVVISGLLSLSVGAALGALTYASVLGLSQVSFLGFLAVGVGASFLPPVAIALGVVAFVCLTALMLNAFSGMLKTDKISSIFTAPFKAVNDVFDKKDARNDEKFKPANRLKIEKGITFAITGALTALGLFGLGMFSWACAGALTQMLSATLGVVPFIATAVGYAVGLGTALVGQIPFILSAVGQSVANIASKCCDLFSPNQEFTASQKGSTFKEKLGSAWDGVLVVINAVGNGALVVPSLIASGFGLAFSAVSAAASFYNSFSAGASSFKAQGAAELKQFNASTARMQRLFGEEIPTIERDEAAKQNKPVVRRAAFLYSALMRDPRDPHGPGGPGGPGGAAAVAGADYPAPAAPGPNLGGEGENAQLLTMSM